MQLTLAKLILLIASITTFTESSIITRNILKSVQKSTVKTGGRRMFSQLKNKDLEPHLESGDGQIFLAGGAALIAYAVFKDKERERDQVLKSLDPLKKRDPAALSRLRSGQISPELLNTRDKFGYTTLMRAVFDNDFELAGELIKFGADINLKTNSNETLLMIAARRHYKKENIEFVELLIEKGVDINAVDSFNFAAINYAIDYGNFGMALALLRHGATTTIRSGILNLVICTPKDLMVSAVYREKEDNFVFHHSDLDSYISFKKSLSQALFLAILFESTGSDPEVLQAAIEQAISYNDPSMVEYLKSLQKK